MPTAARWEETRNPNEWRRKLQVEAASGLNERLGALGGFLRRKLNVASGLIFNDFFDKREFPNLTKANFLKIIRI